MRICARLLMMFLGVGLAISATSTWAATECTGGFAAPLSGKVAGGVVVKAGDFCVLAGANVSGGLQVNGSGILIVCASTINGGVVANGAAEIIFGAEEIGCEGDVINGGVQISDTGPGAFGPPAPSIAVERSVINGGVHLTGNQGPIAVATNRIAGGLFCSNNTFDLEDEGSPSVVTGPVRCNFE